ncbi:MAG: hypothetical protein M1812_004243 [Candelaria pacifica]|nr:MAG: hypothetical protein M1812_004243 [Candelaria pacifica]
MDTSAFDTSPTWTWPDDPVVPPEATQHAQPDQSGSSENDQYGQSRVPEGEDHTHAEPKPKKHYLPRTCRICLETVLPTYNPPSDSLPSVLQSGPSVRYVSSDPEAGRLLRPCRCKGSSKYVHEGCLQAWRHADPGYGRRNYWQCPTCGFQYRLERMQWGRWVSSAATQITLTVSILVLVMFILGFVADPIINLYLDPYTTISSASRLSSKVESLIPDDDSVSWTEHFLKGLASLGLLSFIKVVLALSPWQWWNLRNSGLMSGGGRAGGTGRERLASISWIVVLVGTVYKGVRAWSRRTLEKAGERVMDVHGSDDDDDDDEVHNDQKHSAYDGQNEGKKDR